MMTNKAKTMGKINIKKLIEEGQVHISVIFEVVGQPKEHIENTIKAYVETIKTDEELTFLNEEYEPAEELDEGLFSVIAEVELVVKNLEKITWLAMNFSPASIEIIEPSKFTIPQKDVTNWINDLLSKLHEIGMVRKSDQGQIDTLIRNFNAMTRNAIILSLSEPRNVEQIGKKIGMNKEHAEKFLEALIKEKKIKKEKTKYYLIQ